MLKKTAVFSLLLMFFSASCFAQTEDLTVFPKNPKKLAKEAKWALGKGDLFLAKKYYDHLTNQSDQIEYVYDLALCEMKIRDYEKAESLFKSVHEKDAEQYPLALFYWALMQKANGKYEEAKNNFEAFRKKTRNLKDKSWSKINRNEIEGCDLALRIKDSITYKKIENLQGDINYPHIEFSPIPYGENQLIYGSNKTDDVLFYTVKKDDYKNENKKAPFRKLYLASEKEGEWVTEGEWGDSFNSDNIHSGNGAFSLDKKRFYFTRCEKDIRGKTICKIFYSEKKSDGWSKAILLNDNINLKGFTSTQPTIGKETKKGREVLYFVSDRPEGKGGWDIWYSTYNEKKNTFSEARNAGRKINSPGTECTPYYHPETGKFYFSSNGHPSVGGLDIFENTGEKSQWEDPNNLGFPINSSADDLDYVLKEGKDAGFLVSNRKGGTALEVETCCDDIYSFSEEEIKEEPVVEKEFVNINFNIFNSDNKKNISEATIKIYAINEDGKKLIEEKNNQFNFELEKGKKYEIEISKKDFDSKTISLITEQNDTKKIEMVPSRKTTSTVSTTTTTTKPTITTTPVKRDIKTEIVKLNVGDGPLILEDIYFDFDSDKLRPESIQTIDDVLMHFLTVRSRAIIMIGAHTDSRGNDAYNEDLSQRRAQSVIRYLIQKKGINPRRLQAKGFGENVPIAPNQHSDGSDNPDGRQKNRRVEFSVVGEL